MNDHDTNKKVEEAVTELCGFVTLCMVSGVFAEPQFDKLRSILTALVEPLVADIKELQDKLTWAEVDGQTFKGERDTLQSMLTVTQEQLKEARGKLWQIKNFDNDKHANAGDNYGMGFNDCLRQCQSIAGEEE